MTINKDPYIIFASNGEIIFSGTFQQCLQFEESITEDCIIDVNDNLDEFELQDDYIDYSYED